MPNPLRFIFNSHRLIDRSGSSRQRPFRHSVNLVVSVIAIGMALPAAASAQGAGQLGTAEPLEIRAEAYAQEQLLIRGLQAQYAAALLRERKQADDREQRVISLAETRVLEARKHWEGARKEARALRQALEEAREAFAQRVEEVLTRAQGLEQRLQAYRVESQTLVQQASPEKLDALQRFADGDRLGAWPVIDAITQTELKAIDRAANAAKATKLNHLAHLRWIMLDRGEATAADTMAVFEQLSDLEPLPDVQSSLIRAELATRLGDLSRARKAAEQAVQAAEPGSAESGFALVKLGHILLSQDDLQGAQKHLLASYKVARDLTLRDQSAKPTVVMELLLRTTESLCILLRDRGDLADAREFCETSLSSGQWLAEQIEARSYDKRALASSLDHLGEVLLDQGNLKAALTYFEQGLEIHQGLIAQDAGSITLHRDFLASLLRIGRALKDGGELARARGYLQQSLAISERLVSQDPSDTGLKLALLVTLEALGEVQQALKMLDSSSALFARRLALAQALAAEFPASTDLQRELALGEFDMGVAMELRNDLNGARKRFEQAIAISLRLADRDPAQVALQQDVSLALNKLGDVMKAQGDLAGARKQYEQSLGIAQRLAQGDPSLAAVQTNLHHTLWRLADLTDSKAAWQRVVTQLEHMHGNGAALPADQSPLRTARQLRDAAREP
jgi:tetratricopeptide (TPR) repeat protein